MVCPNCLMPIYVRKEWDDKTWCHCGNCKISFTKADLIKMQKQAKESLTDLVAMAEA